MTFDLILSRVFVCRMAEGMDICGINQSPRLGLEPEDLDPRALASLPNLLYSTSENCTETGINRSGHLNRIY